jgi:hypothetical protein
MDYNVKLLKIRSILFALLLIAMVMIPVAGAGAEEAKRVFPENDTAGYLPVDVISIDPAIKAATPYDMFLILSADGKKTYLENIDTDIDILFATDPKKEEKKAGLVARLNAIWEKYPVVSETRPGGAGYPTYGGSEITIRFAPSVTSTRLTDDENAAIRESEAIMNEVYVKSHPTQPAPLPIIFTLAAFGIAGVISRLQKKGWGS